MLCHFSQLFPTYVELFLNRDRGLRRRFREETVTDLFMGGLVGLGSGSMIVNFPADEARTGNDMEWWFVDVYSKRFWCVLVQAKKLSGRGRVWSRLGYPKLKHTTGRGGPLQVKVLCDTARIMTACGTPTFPLYIFYNPGRACEMARAAGVFSVNGVSVSDGFFIERLVVNGLPHNLKRLSPHMYPLSALFCPDSIHYSAAGTGRRSFTGPFFLSSDGRLGNAVSPGPEEARRRFSRVFPRSVDIEGVDGSDLDIIPQVSEGLPDNIMVSIERSASGVSIDESLDHPRVIFLSDSRRR
ncbi:DUF6615 family protein [Salinarimonas sp.]|uniref:DUF6615 family protein n=1 Tax=Salinarimonas sp. TaxID=2766526 RepID=UPI00391B7765